MLRRILLIDDNRLQFQLTQAQFTQFRAEKFELDYAATYADGLAQLLAGGHAACLLDYQLGERDGLELIHEAVAKGCRTPIIFLTAETSESVDTAAMNAGALDYLVKGELNAAALERSLRYALNLGDTLEQLNQLATHDDLTGLLNRREFDRLLHEEVDRTRRFARPVALVMFDLDHFKRVNDTYGHPAGDLVLKGVAEILERQARQTDAVARYGGEEFALILPETDSEAARAIAERIRVAVEQATFMTDLGPLKITLSLGVATLPDVARLKQELIDQADQALYAAKRGGRNRWVVAEKKRGVA